MRPASRRRSPASRGVSLLECIILVGLVALLAMVGFRAFGRTLVSKNDTFAEAVATLTPTQGIGGGGGCKGGICLPGSGNCFVAGTKVLTPGGEVAIESVRAGDVVVSEDVESGVVGQEHVLRTYVRQAPSIVDLTLADRESHEETLHVTPEHLFWTHDKGWTEAGALVSGEELVDDRGRPIHVVSSAHHLVASVVYNFEVEATHTYFVGSDHVLVHNANYPPGYVPVNDNQGNNTNNCYYASTAALLGQTCAQLEQNSGVPVPPGTATADQTQAFMQQVGLSSGPAFTSSDPAATSQQLVQQAQSQPPGTAFAVGYARPDGTGHVVTGVVGADHSLTFVDFQTDPPTVATGIDSSSVSQVTIFPTNVNVSNNPAFVQVTQWHQTPGDGMLH